MEVILTQDVKSLGRMGQVVKVKPGFARNMLLPRNLAYPATPANIKKMELEKKKKAEENEKTKQSALALSEKLSKVSCTISVEVNDLEKLYGSVTEVDIVGILKDEGFEINKNDILLEKPIEELGIFDVAVKLHPDVTANIRLWVTKK